MKSKDYLDFRKIFIFWLPLFFTWILMAMERPILATIIARLENPKINLAAFGVAFSLALLFEAPIIMMLSASTALVKNKNTYIKLRNFTVFLNFFITILMLIIIIPPIFNFLAIDLINLTKQIAELTHISCIILLPWPAAIGFRRFYQGVLINNNQTKRVGYGTVIRLVSSAGFGFLLYFFSNLKGTYVGASALSFGVIMEAIASRLMAITAIKNTLKSKYKNEQFVNYKYIIKFYFPLSLTSILSIGVNPLLTFFLGRSRFAIASLAVYPVVESVVFIFRSTGLSFQEVAISLLGQDNKNFKKIFKFSLFLFSFSSGILLFISITPLSKIIFHNILGLSMNLSNLAKLPTFILFLLPGLSVFLSFQRAFVVNSRKTSKITIATAIEVFVIFSGLLICIGFLNMVGVISAAISLIIGRVSSNVYLFLSEKREYFKKTYSIV